MRHHIRPSENEPFTYVKNRVLADWIKQTNEPFSIDTLVRVTIKGRRNLFETNFTIGYQLRFYVRSPMEKMEIS